jgi:hypothetical protein
VFGVCFIKIKFEIIILDTLTLAFSSNGNESVPFTNVGIAWSTDKAVKFKNPTNPATCKYKNIYFKNRIFFFEI